MKKPGRLWTKEETEAALRMKKEGRSPAEIAETLSRTPSSVISRIDFVTMPAERRQKVRDRINEYQRSFRAVGLVTIHCRPSVDLLEERDRLLSLPRPLTAELMGDPLPGRSALDRRQQR